MSVFVRRSSLSVKTQYMRGLDVREAATNIWTSSTAQEQPPGYRKLDSFASVIVLRRLGPHIKAMQLLFSGQHLHIARASGTHAGGAGLHDFSFQRFQFFLTEDGFAKWPADRLFQLNHQDSQGLVASI